MSATTEAKLTAREAALKALVRVEKDQAYLNFALKPLLSGLSQRDRALAQQIAFGTVQRLNTLDWALGPLLKHPLSRLTPWIRNILRLSAYQLIYLERIPAHAAVDEAVQLAGRYGHRGVAGLVNAVLRRLARRGADLPWPGKDTAPAAYLSLRYSIPAWLAHRRLERFGPEEAEALCRADNQIAPPRCGRTACALPRKSWQKSSPRRVAVLSGSPVPRYARIKRTRPWSSCTLSGKAILRCRVTAPPWWRPTWIRSRVKRFWTCAALRAVKQRTWPS